MGVGRTTRGGSAAATDVTRRERRPNAMVRFMCSETIRPRDDSRSFCHPNGVTRSMSPDRGTPLARECLDTYAGERSSPRWRPDRGCRRSSRQFPPDTRYRSSKSTVVCSGRGSRSSQERRRSIDRCTSRSDRCPDLGGLEPGSLRDPGGQTTRARGREPLLDRSHSCGQQFQNG